MMRGQIAHWQSKQRRMAFYFMAFNWILLPGATFSALKKNIYKKQTGVRERGRKKDKDSTTHEIPHDEFEL